MEKRTLRQEPANPTLYLALSYSIAGAVAATGMSRTRIYEEIAAGNLKAVKAGRQTLIRGDSLRELIDGLPTAEIGTEAKIGALDRSDAS